MLHQDDRLAERVAQVREAASRSRAARPATAPRPARRAEALRESIAITRSTSSSRRCACGSNPAAAHASVRCASLERIETASRRAGVGRRNRRRSAGCPRSTGRRTPAASGTCGRRRAAPCDRRAAASCRGRGCARVRRPGAPSPDMTLSSVVLPEPFGPTRPWIVPRVPPTSVTLVEREHLAVSLAHAFDGDRPVGRAGDRRRVRRRRWRRCHRADPSTPRPPRRPTRIRMRRNAFSIVPTRPSGNSSMIAERHQAVADQPVVDEIDQQDVRHADRGSTRPRSARATGRARRRSPRRRRRSTARRERPRGSGSRPPGRRGCRRVPCRKRR